MRLLLDTHALLWALGNDPTLRPGARSAIADRANEVYVSAASAWEMAIKAAAGRLETPPDLEAQLAHEGIRPLPITVAHGLAAGALPRLHGDPFDRMLVAQARTEGLVLVTRDRALGAYGLQVLEA